MQGARKVREAFPHAVSIFVGQTVAELEKRLRGRGTETEDRIARRLETARRELACADEYQHYVVNDTVDQTVADICNLLMATKERV